MFINRVATLCSSTFQHKLNQFKNIIFIDIINEDSVE